MEPRVFEAPTTHLPLKSRLAQRQPDALQVEPRLPGLNLVLPEPRRIQRFRGRARIKQQRHLIRPRLAHIHFPVAPRLTRPCRFRPAKVLPRQQHGRLAVHHNPRRRIPLPPHIGKPRLIARPQLPHRRRLLARHITRLRRVLVKVIQLLAIHQLVALRANRAVFKRSRLIPAMPLDKHRPIAPRLRRLRIG